MPRENTMLIHEMLFLLLVYDDLSESDEHLNKPALKKVKQKDKATKKWINTMIYKCSKSTTILVSFTDSSGTVILELISSLLGDMCLESDYTLQLINFDFLSGDF